MGINAIYAALNQKYMIQITNVEVSTVCQSVLVAKWLKLSVLVKLRPHIIMSTNTGTNDCLII